MESPHYLPPRTSKLNSHRLDFYDFYGIFFEFAVCMGTSVQVCLGIINYAFILVGTVGI